MIRLAIGYPFLNRHGNFSRAGWARRIAFEVYDNHAVVHPVDNCKLRNPIGLEGR
jgi:hypothetical protein